MESRFWINYTTMVVSIVSFWMVVSYIIINNLIIV